MECSNSLISKKKIAHSMAQYVWDSPILKSLVYNPFVLSLFMLLIIWILDFLYGKKFKKNKPSIVAQHMITTYIILAGAFAMNNIIIKHRYRMEQYNKKLDDMEPSYEDETTSSNIEINEAVL